MSDMKKVSDFLAGHQKVSMGMTSGSPDTCKCGERVYPQAADDEISQHRDVAFAEHQADALSVAIFGPVKK